MKNLRTIRLYGKLGARFGRVHRLAVESTAEAVRALCALLPGFEREMMTSRDRGIRYACFLGSRNIGKEELTLSGGRDDIRIAPVVAGAKRGGILQTIIGITLIVAGVMVGIGNPLGLALVASGVAMTLGGVIQMLAPQQAVKAGDSDGNGGSYNFTGAVNTTAQGNPVPVLYGRMIVGSAVISAGIVAEDQAYIGAPLKHLPIPKVLGLFEDL
jgi:predicted phage tail protein